MKLVRLVSSDLCTLGHLEDDEGVVICVTLELPWKGNQHEVSCIPQGAYPVIRYVSPKRGYEVPLLEYVPDRSMIEMHIGNTVADTDGCILLGTRFGADGHSIEDSRAAFTKFMRLLGATSTFSLTVVNPFEVLS